MDESSPEVEISKTVGHGGRRDGAGKPPGTKWPSTLAKEAAREATRAQITDALQPMIAAQITHAQGLKYLVARHKKTGKFAKLTEDMVASIEAGDNPEYEAIEVWSKDPSVQAFTDLLNRALDKPKEQVQEINLTGQINIVDVLRQRHQRKLETVEIVNENGTTPPSGD